MRTLHPARKRDAPVLVADQSWEAKGGLSNAYMWGGVRYDADMRKFRMWYLCRRPPNRDSALLYATSDDGLHWVKPLLGLRTDRLQGSSANNIFEIASSASVIYDPLEMDGAQRYKMLASRGGGYRVEYSADGIHWKFYPRNPVLDQSDTATVTQNPVTGEYLAYFKRHNDHMVRGFPRRVVWVSRSSNFQTWTKPELAVVPDEADDDWARDTMASPDCRAEIYVMTVFPHAAGFIGFPVVFRHTARASAKGPNDGPLDVQIATSPDGRTWNRPLPRPTLISRGAPGTYDGGAIMGTVPPVNVGDETWVYYTANDASHGQPSPPKINSIGRAEWRLHGFVSLDAGPDGGRIETKPMQFGTVHLLVNARVSNGGRLRVALLEPDGGPIAGYGLDQSNTLTTDSTGWAAGWGEKGGGLGRSKPVRVVIEMSNCQLYSLRSEGPAPDWEK
ncbi:MAG: hypothetical protein EXS41_00310 [Opitutaceae bacterium]|nr:hypothetical protein [Opitutaceae bacterium]